ncbi:MAG TPA: hypothetical protein PLH21_06970, partial [Chiayiivirga sp.]|nr:hypothetical protein [Chiayiivirga sp.]
MIGVINVINVINVPLRVVPLDRTRLQGRIRAVAGVVHRGMIHCGMIHRGVVHRGVVRGGRGEA